MSDASPPFWIQALGTLGALVLVFGFVAWGMRRNRNEFRLSRVLGIAFASLLASIPFVAAFWWISPSDVDRRSPWLLAAVFVPVFIVSGHSN